MGYSSEPQEINVLSKRMEKRGSDFFRNYNPQTDQKIASAMMQLYALDVEPLYYPGLFSTIHGDFDVDIDKYIDYLYRKSVFADQAHNHGKIILIIT